MKDILTGYPVHIVRRKLASGETREHVYAFRGGPKMHSEPGTPQFEAEHLAHVKAHKHKTGRDAQRKRLEAGVSRWGQEFDKSTAKKLFQNARERAKGERFDLTEKWVARRMVEIGHRCELTGLHFVPNARRDKRWRRNPYAPSLDRIDSSKGYVSGNVRIVCLAANIALSEWGEEVFFALALGAMAQAAQVGALSNPENYDE